jgi:hypothetical protein
MLDGERREVRVVDEVAADPDPGEGDRLLAGQRPTQPST